MLIARADGHLVRMHLERLEWRPGDPRSIASDEARQERRFYGIGGGARGTDDVGQIPGCRPLSHLA